MKALALLFSLILSLVFSSHCSACIIVDPQTFQVIISEVMADPSPPVLLPEAEFIEIHNRGNTPVDLSGWTLNIGKNEKILPQISFNPGEYLIIVDAESDSLFSGYGRTLPVMNMPPVLNSGQVITLKNSSGLIMHSITFSNDWYRNDSKAQGGWSLEIIDPENPCGGIENWHESWDIRGGTPGMKNSVYTHHADSLPPSLLRATLPADRNILLHFSEPMNYQSLVSTQQYSLNHGLYHPSSVSPVEPQFKEVLLTYPCTFSTELLYTINVLNTLTDCSGNALSGKSFADFAVAKSALTFDVIFNEILFMSCDTLSEFIELYNRSDKVIDLATLRVKLADPGTGIIKKTASLAEHPFILFPGRYMVLTRKAHNLPHSVFLSNPSVILELPSLFSLPDEEGVLVLADSGDQTIDELCYSDQMHEELLKDLQGVSLERVSAENPTNSKGNWHSASTTSGYSTPGAMNSQILIQDNTWRVTINPEICSPDNNGIDDEVTIHLQLDEPGWKATIEIFDLRGRKIKKIINNGLLGTEEYFTWDGKDEEEKPVALGIYIIYGELFNSAGNRKKFKKVIGLAMSI